MGFLLVTNGLFYTEFALEAKDIFCASIRGHTWFKRFSFILRYFILFPFIR